MNGTTSSRWPPPSASGVRGAVLRRAVASMEIAPQPDFLTGEGAVLVCAAHPMDDVLGCGGTIARLVSEGRHVHVFIATDGEATHPRQLPREQLGPIRRAEARAALERLGVMEPNITFSGAPQHRAFSQIPALAGTLAELTDHLSPAAVLTPAPDEGDPDARALCLALTAVIPRSSDTSQIFEYPIWSWRAWPFVRLTIPSPRQGREELADKVTLLATSLRAGAGRRLTTSFPLAVDVTGQLPAKREALALHVSQVDRRNGDPHWWTLDDVDHGDFARCLFAGYELFRETGQQE
jgi:LmbE family N-acetylglucosaminyl deacetylase